MKFMKKMREVQHGSASFWYTDNDVCEDIDIDDDVEELDPGTVQNTNTS